ncbi:hypothetical protein INR49_014643 [Caranx melampygus]|nr:hypothetical protein INR49_014643 [Caranx melampygus]
MSKIEMLRVLINQRLTEAAEEIFGVFGRTIAEYEEEISRSKLEIDRQRRLLDLSTKPQISLQVSSAALCEQQEWSSGLDLNETESPHIKEEEDELEFMEQNDVKFMLFQTADTKKERDDNHLTPTLSKFCSQDLEDSELDPQPGTSVQQTCSELDEDAPEPSDLPSGNGQLDKQEAALSEVVDSYICTICGLIHKLPYPRIRCQRWSFCIDAKQFARKSTRRPDMSPGTVLYQLTVVSQK